MAEDIAQYLVSGKITRVLGGAPRRQVGPDLVDPAVTEADGPGVGEGSTAAGPQPPELVAGAAGSSGASGDSVAQLPAEAGWEWLDQGRRIAIPRDPGLTGGVGTEAADWRVVVPGAGGGFAVHLRTGMVAAPGPVRAGAGTGYVVHQAGGLSQPALAALVAAAVYTGSLDELAVLLGWRAGYFAAGSDFRSHAAWLVNQVRDRPEALSALVGVQALSRTGFAESMGVDFPGVRALSGEIRAWSRRATAVASGSGRRDRA